MTESPNYSAIAQEINQLEVHSDANRVKVGALLLKQRTLLKSNQAFGSWCDQHLTGNLYRNRKEIQRRMRVAELLLTLPEAQQQKLMINLGWSSLLLLTQARDDNFGVNAVLRDGAKEKLSLNQVKQILAANSPAKPIKRATLSSSPARTLKLHIDGVDTDERIDVTIDDSGEIAVVDLDAFLALARKIAASMTQSVTPANLAALDAVREEIASALVTERAKQGVVTAPVLDMANVGESMAAQVRYYNELVAQEKATKKSKPAKKAKAASKPMSAAAAKRALKEMDVEVWVDLVFNQHDKPVFAAAMGLTQRAYVAKLQADWWTEQGVAMPEQFEDALPAYLERYELALANGKIPKRFLLETA